MKTLTLNGYLTCAQPVAVSPPDTALPGDDEKSPKRLPRAGYAKSAPRYIPASTMRHMIRSNVALMIAHALRKHGRSVNLHEVLALSKGFTETKKADGKDKKAPKKTAENAGIVSSKLAFERELRAKNPLLAMLGAWGLPSELRVRNAMPTGDNTYAVTPGLVRKALDEDAAAVLDDDDIAQYELKLEEWSKKDKDSVGLKSLLSGWEEINSGTQCDWGVQIHRADPIKTGAVLAALRAFAHDPVIGAHKAQGRGEVSLELEGSVIERDLFASPAATPVGSVKVGRGVFEATGQLADDLKAFDAEAAAGFPAMDFSIIPLGNGEK